MLMPIDRQTKIPTSKQTFEVGIFVFYSASTTPVALLLFYPKVAMLHPLHSPRSRGGTPVPLFPLQNYLRSCGAR